MAAAVYESIRKLELSYSDQPWVRRSYGKATAVQRVRYPARIRRDSWGTCLDLAVLYASALMRAQIRPFIAITDKARVLRGERAGHAFVIADLSQPLTRQEVFDVPPGLVESRRGELRIEDPARPWAASLLAIDPTLATVDGPAHLLHRDGAEGALDFEGAVAGVWTYLPDEALADLVLCDVLSAQASAGQVPLMRPADNETPAIWTRLPEMPNPRQYPSRDTRRRQVMEARGRIVISGDSGLGKSMLAYEKARRADGGYGWFLNAADQSSLQAELAQAEISQHARRYPGMEKADRANFSEAAIRRLESSDAPWVLVLDNANGDPGEILPLIPRTSKPNQAIIVTTTNRDWLNVWPAGTNVTLEPLTGDDMHDVPDLLRERTGGRPLYYEAVRAAVGSGASVPADPGSDAVLACQLGMQVLAGDTRAEDLAHLVAWAPPVPLPVEAFRDFCAGPELDLGRRLEDAGLARILTRPVASVLMHRLIAEQMRRTPRVVSTADGSFPAPVALLASDAGQRLMIDLGDDDSFSRIEALLGPPRPSDVPARAWGLAVYGVARAGELRGRSEESSELFAKAIDYLDPGRDLSLLSECWNGRARYLKDHPPKDKLERATALALAMTWAERAESLARQAAGQDHQRHDECWDLIRAERARAMRALIMRIQARDIADPAARKARLSEVLEMLRASEATRTKLLDELGEDSPDRDRAHFNLGGPSIGLAKLSRGADAEDYLRQALEAYETAKRIRVDRFGEGLAIRSIAACDYGIALAHYYGALLAVDPLRNPAGDFAAVSPQTRMALLRRATASAWDALRDRSILSSGARDNGDAVKSEDLLIKILEIRKLISAASLPLDGETADELLTGAETEAREEARLLGGLVE